MSQKKIKKNKSFTNDYYQDNLEIDTYSKFSWFSTTNLIINIDEGITNLKMPNVGMYNYSPNIILSNDFEISMDILMPTGGNFLSFGFSENQSKFDKFKGWWNTTKFKELKIKRVDGYVKYFLDGELKEGYNLTSENVYFQFRIYSPKNKYEFTFKNFNIKSIELNEAEKLREKINTINSKFNLLNKKFITLEKNYNDILETYHTYFNIIFVDHILEPNSLLKNTHTLCLELLNLINNICTKYNLKYWLDYGSLLGAIRHQGYIPWDDDIDIAMMREDYNKLINVIDYELKINKIDKDITILQDFLVKKDFINTFCQISIRKNNLLLAGLDIFPYDYLKNPENKIKKLFKEERDKHFINLLNGQTHDAVFKEVYNNLNLTKEPTNNIIPGVEHGIQYNRELILKTNNIFPLEYHLFEGNLYPCPNNPNYYLNSIYGEYTSIPKISSFHSRQNQLKKINNINKIYGTYIDKLKYVNKQYKSPKKY